MKKLLLGSTALAVGGLMAAPAMAADPIKIGVGGYYQFFAVAGQIESNYALNGTSVQYKGVQTLQEGEIHFLGQTKLDNGTTIGVRVELEGWNPPTNTNSATAPTGATPVASTSARTIDEAFMFAFGDWGRMEFGSKDDAAYIMYYGAPSALIPFGYFQHNMSWTNPIASGNNKAYYHTTAMTLDAQYQDVGRINYYTPRFAGLQLGVGYAPKINVGAVSAGTTFANTGPGANVGGICGFNDATNSSSCPTNDSSFQDAFSFGANYLNKFGDVSLGLYAGYSLMQYVPIIGNNGAAAGTGSNQTNVNTGVSLTSWRQFAVGAQFSYAGFTLGGSYIWDNNGLAANTYTGVDNDTRAYALSLMYETGPWQLSVGGIVSYNDNGNGSSSIVGYAAGTSASYVGSQAPGATTACGSFAACFSGNPNIGGLNFGTETASKIEVGANYALGPGIKLVGGVVAVNMSGPSNAVAAQSWGALLGMDFRF